MRIRQAELTPSKIKALLRRQLGDVMNVLRTVEPLTDDRIHLARKTLKRARAGLRLWRNAVGEAVYTRENAALRDAARPLARLRDTSVAIDTIDSLLAQEKKAARRSALEELRREMRKTRLDLYRDLRAAGTLQACAYSVEASRSRINRRRITPDDPLLLNAGLKRIYRRGRKALAALASDYSDENLHELRKQAKFLAHALEIFGRGKGALPKKQLRLASSIAVGLGDDHDLAMLQGQINTLPASPHETRAALLARIGRRRKQLQGKTLKQGRQMYRRKAKVFINDITGLR